MKIAKTVVQNDIALLRNRPGTSCASLCITIPALPVLTVNLNLNTEIFEKAIVFYFFSGNQALMDNEKLLACSAALISNSERQTPDEAMTSRRFHKW